MKLENQTAVITGAGRNIGEAMARLFAKEGAKVAVVDMDEDRGGRVAEEINGGGGEAMYVKANVADEEEVIAMVQQVVERFGRIDVLVNNVAISDNKNIRELTLDEWDRTLAVTLTSQFLCCKHVGEQMISQGDGGRIVNVGSTSGHRGRRSAIAYAAAKGGVANLTRAAAYQLAPYGIRVNSISPNKTGSPVGQEEFDPDRPVPNLLNRPGMPEEQAKAALFLACDDSSFIVGENIFVDGGYSAMMD